MHRFPHFYPHTAHTRFVAERHPSVHPDYLHPEATAVYHSKLAHLRTRQELHAARESPSPSHENTPFLNSHPWGSLDTQRTAEALVVPDVLMPSTTTEPSVTPIIPPMSVQNARIITHDPTLNAPCPQDMFQNSRMAQLGILRPSPFTTLLMTPSDLDHMENSTVCGCCTLSLEHVSEEDEEEWIRTYVTTNALVFFTACAIDFCIVYPSVLYYVSVACIVLRIIALVYCHGDEHAGHDTVASIYGVPLVFLAACILHLIFNASAAPTLVVLFACAVCVLLRHSTHMWIGVVWMAIFIPLFIVGQVLIQCAWIIGTLIVLCVAWLA
jgi:hypothetical protein